ncbi:MAG TPA: MotA/TolQ/ExbB proton channel family protein [Candidatus Methylacidiphilales bacterium]|nr:MotA/TolQ/ExbB proton channel family protein [Candidatus Methylacidiphilales bacterium]
MKRLPLILLILGLIFSIGAPLVGLTGTVLGMMGAFHALGANGISDPKALSGDIGQVLTSTMAGLVVSLGLGLPLIIIALVLHFAIRKPRDPVAVP